MKIYLITTHDDGFAYEYFPTKRAADKYAAEVRRNLREEGWAIATVEIDAVDFKPTREGICSVINGFIQSTCMNEH